MNPDDWRFTPEDRKVTLKGSEYTRSGNTITNSTYFSNHKYDFTYIKVFNKEDPTDYDILYINTINVGTNTASLYSDEQLNTISSDYWAETNPDIELGECLNGFEGLVYVEVPEFWIKSKQTDTKNWVGLYTHPIVTGLSHLKKCYIAAYFSTYAKQNTFGEKWGYLYSLQSNNTLVSVKNLNCYGGDKILGILNTGYWSTIKGKAYTRYGNGVTDVDTLLNRTNSHAINYYLYKNIMVWLYIVEYADRDVQKDFNATLTARGYHLGGLGKGITLSYSLRKQYSNYYLAIVPNGITNLFGNNAGCLQCTIIPKSTTVDSYISRWRGFEFMHTLPFYIEGCISTYDATTGRACYATDNHTYGDFTTNNLNYISTIPNTATGVVTEIQLNTSADIFASKIAGEYYICDYYADAYDSVTSTSRYVLIHWGMTDLDRPIYYVGAFGLSWVGNKDNKWYLPVILAIEN